ncbi:hypothetical protein CEXT_686981 [Caerostris extrusa]|uniref:Uncharacterized protein n=1 Tax=Caerostris extrusa TaxID=172846 RepID=A0AAV4X0W4_CAEEX|nr:hypothetical protein CEXT_686981 [Caerostris extrusa]
MHPPHLIIFVRNTIRQFREHPIRTVSLKSSATLKIETIPKKDATSDFSPDRVRDATKKDTTNLLRKDFERICRGAEEDVSDCATGKLVGKVDLSELQEFRRRDLLLQLRHEKLQKYVLLHPGR